MSFLCLGAIVEGHGEVKALPVLVHRIAEEWDRTQTILLKQVSRVPASSLMKEGELEAEIENLVRKIGKPCGILVLLDCDWRAGCPKFDGPAWLKRACDARPDIPIHLVLAYKEFEAWFIAATESIRGHCGLPQDLMPAENPENIRDAKGWLAERMIPRNRGYAETNDQPELTRVFDMNVARGANSFDKCYREIIALLNAVKAKVSDGQ